MYHCPQCLGQMKPLFTGFFCPNDCDRQPQAEIETYAGKNQMLRGRPMFRQSVLWRRNGNTAGFGRVLCCPYHTGVVPLVCGDEPPDDPHFGGTCKGEGNLHHSIIVWNDEGR